jgi:uroporphyrinogen III methyltransferase/synthase
VYAGKEGGGESVSQAEIERLLVEHGAAGRTVVRLKGGDPFVFGRGGEEAEALAARGIPFAIVPGVTAGVAAPAYAGIPVTHRSEASAVAFVTGHEDPSKADSALDWEALARFPGTLVIYMGVRRLGTIVARLMDAGRPSDESAAVVERGTDVRQRVVSAPLASIAEVAADEGLLAPAVTVIGPVAALHEHLEWFAPGPLAGLAVAVTRARAQSSGLARRLRELGAEVVETPAIRIVPLDGPAPEVERYDLVCLTSPNGVALMFERLARSGRDARALAGARVAAIGPGTAAALRGHGVIADVVPERFVAEALVEALSALPFTRALVARAAGARDVLPDALQAQGAEVDVLELYETVAEPLSEAQLAALERADYVTFTSSSTVRFLLAAAEGGLAQGTRIVSIGPITSATLREHGLEPDVEAHRHDIEGLVEALLADAVAQ